MERAPDQKGRKRYRALEVIAGCLSAGGWLLIAFAALVGAGTFLGHSTGAADLMSAATLSVFLYIGAVAVGLFACGESIRLAIDCATHLETIAANSTAAVAFRAHPAPAADRAIAAPAAGSSAAPETR